MYYLIFIIIVFLLGLYFFGKYGPDENRMVEGMTDNTGSVRCPDTLIEKEGKFYLYNSKIAKIPGVNPIFFESLEDYTEFVAWERSQGIFCPVLYLQHSYNIQGNSVYIARPNVNEKMGGLPPSITTIPSSNQLPMKNPNPTTLLTDAGRNDAPYNSGSLPSFDSQNQNIGKITPLDNMDEQTENMLYTNANPMSDSWMGADYTQDLVDKGYYAEDNVNIYVP